MISSGGKIGLVLGVRVRIVPFLARYCRHLECRNQRRYWGVGYACWSMSLDCVTLVRLG